LSILRSYQPKGDRGLSVRSLTRLSKLGNVGAVKLFPEQDDWQIVMAQTAKWVFPSPEYPTPEFNNVSSILLQEDRVKS
jgi:hypothetical protein